MLQAFRAMVRAKDAGRDAETAGASENKGRLWGDI